MSAIKRLLAVIGLGLAWLGSPALAEDRLVLGLQESGTVQWEIAAIRNLGLDVAHDLVLEVRPLADSRAGQIALQTGAVDVILSDFTWVSAQRHAGRDFTMVPHSLAVGGLMVPADSPVLGLADLRNGVIAVAGGPADKSWVVLQAYYHDLTGRRLAEDVEARFGAPPLVNELLGQGRVDAALNFWHWNARAKSRGMVEVISVADMLRGLGLKDQPPLLGWTFSEANAAAKPVAIKKFLDASFAAKAVLVTDDAAWEDLATLMGAADDRALFEQLRDDYRAGMVTGYFPEDVAAAEQAFALLAEHGGFEVVGDMSELEPGTFWAGYAP
ncbi:MAG: ABC transporter substrate-binding protein [Devosia sp.]|uniref:ABC transporter substrate-binding protein n=1 Tax=Devosia sp. TaxID=1871048 RepID=UPI0024C9C96E|nr:ABC transporter substrate-binding protein [Devosia sp.]UYN98212.1 MAG: ABC transporter substrate-binding protein [Devosia sp.]